MLMQAHSDALPQASERVALRQSRRTTERSDQDRCNVREFDKLEIGRDAFKLEIGKDAFAFYNHAGAIAVAIAWLVIYAIAAIHPLIAWSLSLLQ